MSDEQYMRLAIAVAREGIATGQTPFGACLVRADRVLACAHNAVWANLDITAHAEVQAIRAACAEHKTVDLSGCVLYSTCEPCLMCFSAANWARVERIVYGTEIADAKGGLSRADDCGSDTEAIGQESDRAHGRSTSQGMSGFV